MTTQSVNNNRSYSVQILYGILGILVGVVSGMLVFEVPDVLKLFVLVVGIFAFAVSVARVDWGLLVLSIMIYTNFSEVAIRFHGAPSVAKSFVVLLLAAVLLRWMTYGEKIEGWQRPAILLTAYGIVNFASVLYAADPGRTMDASFDFFKNILIVIVVVILLQGRILLRQVIWAMLGSGIFLGTLTIFQYVTKTFNNNYLGFAQQNVDVLVGATVADRVGGPLGDPNYYALIMMVLIPLAIDRIWNEHNQVMRGFAVWALVATSLSVVFTFSRSGFVALVAVVGLMLLYRTPTLKNLIIMLLAFVLIFQFIPPKYVERIGSLAAFLPGSSRGITDDEALRGRTSELFVGWNMFRDHPFVGVGYDNYPIYYQEYSRQVGMDPRATQRSAHNLYVEILAETGILGLTAFTLIIWLTLRDLLRAIEQLQEAELQGVAGMIAAIGVALLGYLLASIFIHDAYQRYFMLIIGIAMAAPSIAKNELRFKKRLEQLRAQGMLDAKPER